MTTLKEHMAEQVQRASSGVSVEFECKAFVRCPLTLPALDAQLLESAQHKDLHEYARLCQMRERWFSGGASPSGEYVIRGWML